MCRSWILAIIDFKETWLNIIKFTRELQKHVDLLTKMTRLDQPFDEYCNTSTVYTYFASEAVAIYLPQRREISWAPLLVGVILVFILFSSVDSMYIQFNFFWSGQDRYISDAMPCQEQICQGLSGKWCFWEVLKVTITYYNHVCVIACSCVKESWIKHDEKHTRTLTFKKYNVRPHPVSKCKLIL